MNANKPVAWARQDGVIAFHKQKEVDSQGYKWFPLYTYPVKYCPSEDSAAYEKGLIDGMAEMTESVVHRAVEGMAVKELTDVEISLIAEEFTGADGLDVVDFGRAILRKAQEK